MSEASEVPNVVVQPSGDAMVNLKIMTLTGKIIPILANVNDTVDELKGRIEAAEGIPPEFQRLIFAGRELLMPHQLLNFNVVEGSSIHLVLRRNQPQQQAPQQVMSDEEYARQLQQQEMAAVSGGVIIPPSNNPLYMASGLGMAGGFAGPGRRRHDDSDEDEGHGVGQGQGHHRVGAVGLARGPNGEAVVIQMPASQAAAFAQAEEETHVTMSMARAVRMFSIIDAVFLIIWAFNYWILALGIVLTLCGYFGARHYKPSLVIAYLVYLLFSIGLRIFWMTVVESMIYVIILGLGVAIEVYILRMVYLFYKRISNLTDGERLTLAEGGIIGGGMNLQNM